MMLRFVLLVAVTTFVQADYKGNQGCIEEYRNAGMSINFPRNVAHAIHGPLNVGLPYFNPRVGARRVLSYYFDGMSQLKNVSNWKIYLVKMLKVTI